MLDRTLAPDVNEIQEVKFVYPTSIELNEHVSLFWMKDVPNETSRIDFYFDAGTIRAKSLISSLTAGLIFSGTQSKDSTTFHNLLDDAGAYYDAGVSHENAVVSFYSLNDQLLSIFKIFEEAMNNVIFPQAEIDEILNERKQKFLVSLEKVGVISQREFQKLIFQNSDYARHANLEDFDRVSRAEIIDFFEQFYRNGLTKIVVVGSIESNAMEYIVNQSKKWCIQNKPKFETKFSNKPIKLNVEKQDALQSAVRIGKILFNKNHEDYISFSILNTILGDYFGSRLMKNIREDKGYTYGIGSYVSELNNTGYLIIATEVGKDFRDNTIDEVRKEIEKLQTELVEEAELDLVRNYLLGQILKSADGPYAMTDLFIGVSHYNLTLEFYNKYIQKVQTITPLEIRDLAIKHLNWDSFSIVTAG